MRFLFLLLLVGSVSSGTVSPARGAPVDRTLEKALKEFRPDPPRGWSYTLTTSAQGQSTVERYDATRPEFDRWSLVRKNDRAPTVDEARVYSEVRSRRSRGGTAPRITDQFDLATLEVVGAPPERIAFRCRLKPGERGDETARFLRATIVVHVPTSTIESIALASTSEFNPTFAVRIQAMKTVLTYRPPRGETPGLPLAVTTHVRGRAFRFKSLDADMTVTYSDYEPARKRDP